VTPNASRTAARVVSLLRGANRKFVSGHACSVDWFCVHMQWLVLEAPFSTLHAVPGTNATHLLGLTSLQAELKTCRKLHRLIRLLHTSAPARESLVQALLPSNTPLPEPVEIQQVGTLYRMLRCSREIGVRVLCEHVHATTQVSIEWTLLDESSLSDLAEFLDVFERVMRCASEHAL
jgi:hypothetical protein